MSTLIVELVGLGTIGAALIFFLDSIYLARKLSNQNHSSP